MKKLIAYALIFALALSLLSACGGGGNTPAPPASDSSNSNVTQTDKPDNAKTEVAKTPEITVNPGDVVFDNDIVQIIYTETATDTISLDIHLVSKNNSDQEITIWTRDLAINEKKVGIGATFTNISPGKTDDEHWIMLTHKNLEGEGFSAGDIKTIQITFEVVPTSGKGILFEGTALFNIT